MLTEQEKIVIGKMPEELRQYVLNKFSTPIKDISDYDLEMGCFRVVKDIMDAFSPGKDQTPVIKNIYQLLVKDLRRPKFNLVAFAEIEDACYRGVRKEYGDFFSPNITVICGWIDSHLKSKERLEALNQFIIYSKQAVSYTPVTDKTIFSKSAIVKAFEHYKITKEAPFASWAYYNILVEIKGIDYQGKKTLIANKEERNKIIETVTEKFKDGLEKEHDRFLKRGQTSQADQLMKVITGGLEKSSSLQNRIKEAFLKHYFDGLIKNKSELNI